MLYVWMLACLHDLDVNALYVISIYLLNVWDGYMVKVLWIQVLNIDYPTTPKFTFPVTIPTIGIRAKFSEEEALQI